ncbi:unnamed protein product [Cuscuta epithymum]|uniref:Uncharacterized protein n=1 Tax=Cuscuta epithymum TaxID=186058 RepID=A0AAV0EFH7_9ASTE|nr:unnamed protein product [Cuscuta epithymum]
MSLLSILEKDRPIYPLIQTNVQPNKATHPEERPVRTTVGHARGQRPRRRTSPPKAHNCMMANPIYMINSPKGQDTNDPRLLRGSSGAGPKQRDVRPHGLGGNPDSGAKRI